jgi:hypothetical protein
MVTNFAIVSCLTARKPTVIMILYQYDVPNGTKKRCLQRKKPGIVFIAMGMVTGTGADLSR